MPTKAWGFLCPEDQGLLLEVKGSDLLYCPNARHYKAGAANPGGLYARAGLVEGYAMADKSAGQGTGLTKAQIDAMKAAAAADDDAAKAPAKAKATDSDEAKPKRSREPKQCGCGCGGLTKGGTFLPGHDAKFHSAQKAAEKAEAAPATA